MAEARARKLNATDTAVEASFFARLGVLPNFDKIGSMFLMATMNISLPDDLKAFIDRQVSERSYGTSSEFIRELVRREHERLQLRAFVIEGMASPAAGEADAAYFAGLRERAAGRLVGRKAPARPARKRKQK